MSYTAMKTEKKAKEAVATIVDKVFRYVTLSCLLVHLVYLVLFIIYGRKLFIITNVISVLTYTILSMKKFHLTPNTHFCVLNLEILIHMSLAVLFLGWDFGFQYYLIFLFTAVFMKVLNNIRYVPAYAVIQAAAFITLRIVTYQTEPFYKLTIGEGSVRIACMVNIFTFFIGAFVLARAVNDSNLLYRAFLAKDNKELEEQAQEDYLTGLANRRSLYSQFDYLKNSATDEFTYCIAIGDIDDFKLINDKWGHEVGDAILVNMSEIIRKMVRDNDIVCRWGGEEIVIVMPNMPRHLAYERIERIRERIEKECIQNQSEKIYATITFGVCGNCGEMNLEKVVSKADELLYQGKKNGKNQVVKEKAIG